MKMDSYVLIVEDEAVNRRILKKIIIDDYSVLEAANGKEAIDILAENKYNIVAIILDLVMPVCDGYEFLELYNQEEKYRNIPVLVSTCSDDVDSEINSLKLGARDFVKKPYNADLIKFRLKNAIEHSAYQVLKEMQHKELYDSVTGIYKKSKFVNETAKLLKGFNNSEFVMLRFDISNFQLYNAIFGEEEGDNLLRFISTSVINDIVGNVGTFCREEADVFYVCFLYDSQDTLKDIFVEVRDKLHVYNKSYDIVPNFGIYIINDREEQVERMMDKAKLASKQCKGNYITNYAFYTEKISNDKMKEQNITNTMNFALENEHFALYIQPKYELENDNISGGEVLVRWIDPNKGMISPGEFIPIFEKNGFILKLDYYVWDHACQIIRKWLDEGKEPFPISVNVSRVSLFNPNLVNDICDLVDKYGIEPRLLQLELTESAYTSNPQAIKDMMNQLQQKGFTILMDDFGSGYSSLNVLKDIAVDILKIDMKFMSKCDIPGRSENILASVIRMAKWLNMPVIAEGVEEKQQIDFLRSIGCEFVQGYYYAKPMPVGEYEELAFSDVKFSRDDKDKVVNADTIWQSTSELNGLFSNMLQAVALYEYNGDSIETIRVNNAYYELFGFANLNSAQGRLLDFVLPEYREGVRQTFDNVIRTEGVGECEYQKKIANENEIWVNMKLKYVNEVAGKHLLYGMLSDISDQKKLDKELQNYRDALQSISTGSDTILIVDDVEVNREVLVSIFDNKYEILQAENGEQALEMINDSENKIDLILLDLMMPVMDGKEVLKRLKQSENMKNIPVIIITSDDNTEQQVDTLEMGANDYIVKPFVPEVVVKRVANVLDSTKRLNDVLKIYNSESQDNRRDVLTGLYNRNEVDKLIQKGMSDKKDKKAILLIDIDNMRTINDTYGRKVGDKVIRRFADELKNYFRRGDIVARYDGDEFLVMVVGAPSREFIVTRCENLLKDIQPVVDKDEKAKCTIGIAYDENGDVDALKLVRMAEAAIKQAKEKGENTYTLWDDIC